MRSLLRLHAWKLLLVALLAACHDAQRNNPLDPSLQQAVLRWNFWPPAGVSHFAQDSVAMPVPLFAGFPYKVDFELLSGEVSVSLRGLSTIWNSSKQEGGIWAALAPVGQGLALTAGDEPHAMKRNNELISFDRHVDQVSELRAHPTFAGSIALDEEGNIYVADVGNKRIQKFSR